MNFSFPTVTIYLIKVLVLLQQNVCVVNFKCVTMEPVPETAENRVRERLRPMIYRDSHKSPTIRGSGGRHREILGFEEVVLGVVNRTKNLRNSSIMPE